MRRERFLTEMNVVIPWARLLGLIEPYYPKAGKGTQPLPLSRTGGPRTRSYDSESMRRFAGAELAEEVIPDESTILRFRHLLERHRLTERIFAEVRGLLEEKRLRRSPARSPMPRSLPPRPRPRMPRKRATRRCAKPARATSGISA